MKNRNLLIIVFCLLISVLLCACNPNGSETNQDGKNSTKIIFSDNGASVKGIGASAQGTDVRIGAAGTYTLSGSTSDGSVIIDAGKAEIVIVLDSVLLTNTDGPAIFVKNAKKVTFELPEGSNSILTDGNSYEIKEINTMVDGTIFAKSDLVFSGVGTLTVNGNNAHGIVAKDGLKISDSNINVVSKSAGVCGKDYIEIENANLNINSGTDGLRSDNVFDFNKGYIAIKSGSFNITSGGDAIQASDWVRIEGGNFNIKTTLIDPMLSMKGIKGTEGIEISGGNFVVDSIDDGLHSDADVMILGGDISVSSGDDGVHANDKLTISGGNLTISKSYEGLEATVIEIIDGRIEIVSTDDGINSAGGNDQSAGSDSFDGANGSFSIKGGYTVINSGADGIDVIGSFDMSDGVLVVNGPSKAKSGAIDFGSTSSITGGVVVALGLSNTAKNFSNATQGTVLLKNGSYDANAVYSICDENGNVIIAFTSTKGFNGMLVSAPELKQGNTYTVYINASVVGLDQNGFAHNTTQTDGEALTSVTFDTLIK